MAASQAQRTVNIYPGLPRTGLINEKKRPVSAHSCPRGIITSLFLILYPHTCNPLSVLSHVINGFHPVSMTDYHTVEAHNLTSWICDKSKTSMKLEQKLMMGFQGFFYVTVATVSKACPIVSNEFAKYEDMHFCFLIQWLCPSQLFYDFNFIHYFMHVNFFILL